MNKPQPHPDSPTTAAGEWAGFLAFVGPLVAIGGALAMIRLWRFDWFFAAMIPIGIALAIYGNKRRTTTPDQPPE